MIRELPWILKRAKQALLRAFSQFATSMHAWKYFWESYHDYRLLLSGPQRDELAKHLLPQIYDNIPVTMIEPVYFYQDAWAFERIVANLPEEHIDVGSHHKYVALLSKVVPVTMIDIRPLPLSLNTLKFKYGSILALPFLDGSVESLSSLCVVEHIGLGRYGDPLDPNGTEKAIQELKRVIKPGGSLYISLPVGKKNRTYFNAHRVLEESYLLSLFQPFQILDKQYIYQSTISNQLPPSGAVGCYHLQRSSSLVN